MKRNREETIIENNYFFPVIILQPGLLCFIFENLPLIDLLTIYKILYQYFIGNESVMIILEDYLEENYCIDEMTTILFQKKVKKLEYLVLLGNIEDYSQKINKYKTFRYTKNFVKYGLCDTCHYLPNKCDQIDFVNVTNRNLNELECKVIYNCELCNKVPDNNLFYSTKQFIQEIGLTQIACFYADHFGIRTDWRTPRFYKNDYIERAGRKKQIDNINESIIMYYDYK